MASYAVQAWTVDLWQPPGFGPIYDNYHPVYIGGTQAVGDPWWQAGSDTATCDDANGVFSAEDQDLTSKLATIWTPTVPGANQFASCGVRIYTIPGGGASYAGLSLRFRPDAGGGDPDCYALVYDTSVPGWKLIKQHAGAQTVLATYGGAGQGITAGQQGSCSLAVEGTSLKPVTNGVAHTSVTDAVISAAGGLGVFLGTQGGGDVAIGIHVTGYVGGYLP